MMIARITLSTRLFLIVLGGVFLAITLSNAFQRYERKKVIEENRIFTALDHFSDVSKLLAPLEPNERVKVLESLSDKQWQFKHDIAIVFPEGSPNPKTAELLSEQLGEEITVEGAWILTPEDCTDVFHCSIKVSAWVKFIGDQKILMTYTPSPRRRYGGEASFLLRHRDWFVLIITALLAWVVVRLSLRPLKQMTNAVTKFGNDMNTPPLKEGGPPEVSRAVKAFNTMQQQIQGFMSERTQILAAVTHDLKTPMTRMRLRLEHCHEPELKEKLQHDLEAMQNLVDEGLELARSMHSLEPHQLLDLGAMIHSICDDLIDTGANIEHQDLLDSKPMLVNVQALALRRILENIIDNALKYGNRAHINCEVKDDRVVNVYITDQGPGIPEAKLECVRKPFMRLEESRSRETGGTGLGLSIATNLIKTQKGDIYLHNLPEGGLRVTVSLPIAKHEQAPDR